MMSTPEELEDLFVHDEEDDTFCLQLWMERSVKDELIAWCLRTGISPVAIIWRGTRTLIDASANSNGTVVVTGLPSSN